MSLGGNISEKKSSTKKQEKICYVCGEKVDYEIGTNLTCVQGHDLCSECSYRLVNVTLMPEMNEKTFPPRCMICKMEFNRSVFERNIEEKMIPIFQNLCIFSNLSLEEGEVLVNCPECSYQEIPKTKESPVFTFCKNLGCKKTTCYFCKKIVQKDALENIGNYDLDKIGSNENLEIQEVRKHLMFCSKFGPMKIEVESIILDNSTRTCPNPECGLKGMKDENCTHITCGDCQTVFCYICGKDAKDFGNDIYGHNNDWNLNDSKCPASFYQIHEFDPTWPEAEAGAKELFHRKLILTGLKKYLLEQGVEEIQKLVDIYPSILSGFTLKEIEEYDHTEPLYMSPEQRKERERMKKNNSEEFKMMMEKLERKKEKLRKEEHNLEIVERNRKNAVLNLCSKYLENREKKILTVCSDSILKGFDGNTYSICYVHYETLNELGFFRGDCVRIVGKGGKNALAILFSCEDCPKNHISLNLGMRSILDLKCSDICEIYSMEDIEYGEEITITTVSDYDKEQLEISEKDFFEHIITNYFKDCYLPVKAGDVYIVGSEFSKNTTNSLEFRIDSVKEKRFGNKHCIVSPKTKIIWNGNISDQLEKSKIGFLDIGGCGKLLQELENQLILLKKPDIKKLDSRNLPIRHILISGFKGTGKTLILEALKNETNFYTTIFRSCDILGRKDEEVEFEIRKAFENCSKKAPAILLLDDLDVMCEKSEFGKKFAALLCSLMDTVKKRKVNVLVIGTANINNLKSMENMLFSSQKFGKILEIPIPNEIGRLENLRILTKDMKLDDDVDLEKVSMATPGFTALDFKKLIENAGRKFLGEIYPLISNESECIKIDDRLGVNQCNFFGCNRIDYPNFIEGYWYIWTKNDLEGYWWIRKDQNGTQIFISKQSSIPSFI